MRIRPAATTVVLLAAIAGFVAFALPSQAAAKAKPCWVRVQDDWLDDGIINGKYPVRCLQQALQNVQEDLRDYSNITDAIDAAIQTALRGGGKDVKGNAGPAGSTGSGSGSGGNGPSTRAGKNRKLLAAPPQSYYRRAIDSLGSTKAESLPIPLLVLAGLGTALLLSAAGLAAHKRLKARPKPPPA
jgi:hypothetical protein